MVAHPTVDVLMVIEVFPMMITREDATRILSSLEALDILVSCDYTPAVRRGPSRWKTQRQHAPEQLYEFRSQLVQDVLYKLLSDKQRRELHKAAAQVHRTRQGCVRAGVPVGGWQLQLVGGWRDWLVGGWLIKGRWQIAEGK